MSSPTVTIIMVDGSFRESFHALDFFGNQSYLTNKYEMLWVEYYSDLHPSIRRKIDALPNARAICLGKTGVYHSSYCFNQGIVESQGEIIYIPDGDVAVEEDFLDSTIQDHLEYDKLAMYFYRVNEPQDRHNPNVSIDHIKSVGSITNPSNYGGCLSVRKKWLLEVNGYEQHPVFATGFHANGHEMYTKLRNLGLAIRWHPDKHLYHSWHPSTTASAPQYEVQRHMLNFKTINLEKKSFHGIQKDQNKSLPHQLELELNRKYRQSKLIRIQLLFKKILSHLKKHFMR